MRSDAALSVLTEEQQADLFNWLTTDTYDVVLKCIAQPPPDGFGIKTHINSLYRFYEQRQAQLRARDLANIFAPQNSPDPSITQDSEKTQSSVLRTQLLPWPARPALPRFHDLFHAKSHGGGAAP